MKPSTYHLRSSKEIIIDNSFREVIKGLSLEEVQVESSTHGKNSVLTLSQIKHDLDIKSGK